MLDLFGRVPERMRAAYDEAHPLADGYRARTQHLAVRLSS
jgi:fructosamine-3-kinase